MLGRNILKTTYGLDVHSPENEVRIRRRLNLLIAERHDVRSSSPSQRRRIMTYLWRSSRVHSWWTSSPLVSLLPRKGATADTCRHISQTCPGVVPRRGFPEARCAVS